MCTDGSCRWTTLLTLGLVQATLRHGKRYTAAHLPNNPQQPHTRHDAAIFGQSLSQFPALPHRGTDGRVGAELGSIRRVWPPPADVDWDLRSFKEANRAAAGILFPAQFGDIRLLETPNFRFDDIQPTEPWGSQVGQGSEDALKKRALAILSESQETTRNPEDPAYYPRAPWFLEVMAAIQEPEPEDTQWDHPADRFGFLGSGPEEEAEYIKTARWNRKASAELTNLFNEFQAAARLFRPGHISVVPYEVWSVDPRTDALSPAGLPSTRKPPRTATPMRSWWSGDDLSGPFDVENLQALIDFLKSSWTAVARSPAFRIPLLRFSQSIDRFEHTDRLIDLMVALEALFSEAGETSYKVAIRCASFVYPPSQARYGAFRRMVELYRRRNDILHGRSVSSLTTSNLDLLEDHVRGSLAKVLEQLRNGQPYPKPSDFDKYILLPWQS